MKLYTYANCDNCRKGTKWLRDNGIDFVEIPIRDHPPSKAELKRMLVSCGGDLRRLFNTSGMDYRTLSLKDKLPAMSEDEAIGLLAGNGNLIKRPFLLDGDMGLVGFKEEEWKCQLL